jgi:hypothetical protein
MAPAAVTCLDDGNTVSVKGEYPAKAGEFGDSGMYENIHSSCKRP